MDFSNTLPGSGAFADDKSTPHVFIGRAVPTTSGAESPSCRNVRWTPARLARYEYVLHIVSLTLGTLTLCAYIFDLAKSASYHVGVPVGITVVDTLSIAFLAINNTYSLVYFVTGMNTRISQGDLSRKWPAFIDMTLHCLLVGMADSTFSMRSSTGKSCDKNRAVGGCLTSRRALMIAAGVLMILVR
jgi:hypothetical protein